MALVKKNEGGSGELGKVLASLRKDFGDKSILEGNNIPMPERLATGIFELDLALGGGFPKGRISMVYGPESSGKTNCAYKAAAVAQRGPASCNKVVFIDLEGTFDPKWAARMGVDTEALFVVKPGYGEQAVDMIEGIIYADDVALIIVDSLAQLTPSKEIEKEAESHHPGRAAMLAKRMINKMVIALSEEWKRGHEPVVIIINQTRYKMVLMGDPETMPGGQAPKFMSSIILRVRGKNIMDKNLSSEKPAYKQTIFSIKKAKCAVNQTSGEYDMCVADNPTLEIGETNSWNSCLNHLKGFGIMVKHEKSGWVMDGVHEPTLAPFGDRYKTDMDYRLKLQAMVFKKFEEAGESILVEADAAVK